MSKFVILLTVLIAVICSAAVPKNTELLPGRECAPGSSWKSQCNDCQCSNEGLALCTRALCTGDETDPIRECAPDTAWKKDCNTCRCDDGIADCTRMECITTNVTNMIRECAPGTTWKDDCNTCWCYDGRASCTKMECITTNITNPPTQCLQPIVVGNCRASILSYGYNAETKKCERFIYGGCEGNSNRFETKHECEKTCING